jgi:Tfp pilus assembly protein PilF
VSQLFDALKRNRRASPSPEHVERTARADAVLATLGYRKKKRASPSQRAAILAVCGLAVALVVAWAQWPREMPRAPRTTAAGRPPAPSAPPRSAIPEPSLPAITPPEPAPPPALTQAPPAAAAVAPAPTPAPVETSSTRPRGTSAPPANVAGRRASPLPAEVPPPAAPRAESSTPPPVVASAELFRLAIYYHRAGDLVTAETNYRALLQRNELDPQVHNNLGLLYRDRGLVEESIREFQRALIINPQYGTARNNLGVILMSAARLDDAAVEFRRVLAQDPRSADAAVNLALVDKAGGRPERAKESLLRALTIEPDNAPAHFNLAALYEQSGENARAVEHYRSFLEHAGAEHASRTPDARARLDALARPR